ncbi:MAG: YibE/F family protein [Eubacterium sp.]|nr:YibE/F family protein [Eubacterium sp.]MCM1417616.1 YibE/F family protein [Roseburia sp.]
MPVIAIVSVSGENVVCTVYSADRTLVIFGFVLIFILCLWFVGGKKGLRSALCLGVSLVLIFFVFFPLVYRGFSPFFGAMTVAAASTLITILAVGGFNRKSVSAILGTVFGVCAAGAAAMLFGAAAGISGYNVSEIESLLFVAQHSKVKIGGLLFAGILISSLGAVMDVAMSISSTLNEIREKRPELPAAELFKSGIKVGRDMMGTMSNTLILAFAGGSLITLVINYAYDLPLLQILNSYNIGIEIMQGISGSLGVILTVPFTSFAAAKLLTRK